MTAFGLPGRRGTASHAATSLQRQTGPAANTAVGSGNDACRRRHACTVSGLTPARRAIRRLLGRLTLDDVLECLDIAASRMPVGDDDQACRYFYGVCWRTVDRLEGQAR